MNQPRFALRAFFPAFFADFLPAFFALFLVAFPAFFAADFLATDFFAAFLADFLAAFFTVFLLALLATFGTLTFTICGNFEVEAIELVFIIRVSYKAPVSPSYHLAFMTCDRR